METGSERLSAFLKVTTLLGMELNPEPRSLQIQPTAGACQTLSGPTQTPTVPSMGTDSQEGEPRSPRSVGWIQALTVHSRAPKPLRSRQSPRHAGRAPKTCVQTPGLQAEDGQGTVPAQPCSLAGKEHRRFGTQTGRLKTTPGDLAHGRDLTTGGLPFFTWENASLGKSSKQHLQCNVLGRLAAEL